MDEYELIKQAVIGKLILNALKTTAQKASEILPSHRFAKLSKQYPDLNLRVGLLTDQVSTRRLKKLKPLKRPKSRFWPSPINALKTVGRIPGEMISRIRKILPSYRAAELGKLYPNSHLKVGLLSEHVSSKPF